MYNITEVKASDIKMDAFKPKKELNSVFFKDNDTLDSQIRLRLLDIADDFVDTLEIKWVKPIDIVLTGSLVNYNWSEYSDVDVHIIYDYSKIYNKKDFIQDYFMSKKDNWNGMHENLKMKGFQVEVSVEDVNAPLQSSGVYSLEKNKWVKKPSEMDGTGIDIEGIKKYCAKQMTKMDKLFTKMDEESDRKRLEDLATQLETIIDEIHDKRKEGLKTNDKELSNGNIMWKVVKHMGYVPKAYKYINMCYDRSNTIKETRIIRITESQAAELRSKSNLYAPLSKFIQTINKTLYLKGEYLLNPNNQDDKRIAYAAFAKAGYKNIGTMKGTEDMWVKRMTSSDWNRSVITRVIKQLKDEQYSKQMDEYETKEEHIDADQQRPNESDMEWCINNIGIEESKSIKHKR